MKSLLALALSLFAATLLAFPVAAQEKKGVTPAALVGSWSYVSGMHAGKEVPKDHLAAKVTVSKTTFTVPAGKEGTFTIAYKLNNKVSPTAIDLDITKGPEKGKAMGIIALEEGKMKLCYVLVTGKDVNRPAKFESTKDNGAFYFVLKRAKAPKKD